MRTPLGFLPLRNVTRLRLTVTDVSGQPIRRIVKDQALQEVLNQNNSWNA